jgi:aspartyl protease family protein
MTNPDGPWSRLPPPPRVAPPPRRGLHIGLWVAALAAFCAGLYGLTLLFPGRVSTGADWGDVARGVLVVAFVLAGVMSRRFRMKRLFRDIAIWTAVILLGVLLYSFRAEIEKAAGRVRSEIVPSYPVASAAKELMITRDADGGFYVTGNVNGQPVRFVVDTGASDIVLSPADAQRLGLDPASLSFTKSFETANGVGLGAPYTAGDFSVGSIRLTNVPMSVNKAAMSSSLLGMAFFNRLQSFRFEGAKLYLKPRS